MKSTGNFLTLEWSYNGDVLKDAVEIMKGSSKILPVQGALGGFPLNTEWHISMSIVNGLDAITGTGTLDISGASPQGTQRSDGTTEYTENTEGAFRRGLVQSVYSVYSVV